MYNDFILFPNYKKYNKSDFKFKYKFFLKFTDFLKILKFHFKIINKNNFYTLLGTIKSSNVYLVIDRCNIKKLKYIK